MNNLLRPQIWPFFLASSGVGSCGVPFGYASEPTPCTGRKRLRCAWHGHPRGLATEIREISGLRKNNEGALKKEERWVHGTQPLWKECTKR